RRLRGGQYQGEAEPRRLRGGVDQREAEPCCLRGGVDQREAEPCRLRGGQYQGEAEPRRLRGAWYRAPSKSPVTARSRQGLQVVSPPSASHDFDETLPSRGLLFPYAPL